MPFWVVSRPRRHANCSQIARVRGTRRKERHGEPMTALAFDLEDVWLSGRGETFELARGAVARMGKR
jgi:hypothetical protein